MAPTAQSKRWVFTLNNYTAAEYDLLVLAGARCEYLILGKEVSASGTPHLQGFAIFSANNRLAAVKTKLGVRCHVEVARGTSLQASTYCQKDGDFTEFGDFDRTPPQQGRRTDWERFTEWIAQQPSRPSAYNLAQEWPSLYGRYPASCLHFIDLLYPIPPLVTGELRPWQTDLDELLEAPADDRKVIFVVDPAGNIGKSWFLKWFLGKYPQDCQRLAIGKRDDLAYAIDPSKRFFFFDIPRTQSEFLQYSVLEQLKDQMVFSPKYHSVNKILPTTVHVVVFMNEEPDMTKMTGDRFNIMRPVIPFAAWHAPVQLGTFNHPLTPDDVDDVTTVMGSVDLTDDVIDLSQDY